MEARADAGVERRDRQDSQLTGTRRRPNPTGPKTDLNRDTRADSMCNPQARFDPSNTRRGRNARLAAAEVGLAIPPPTIPQSSTPPPKLASLNRSPQRTPKQPWNSIGLPPRNTRQPQPCTIQAVRVLRAGPGFLPPPTCSRGMREIVAD